MPTNTQDPSPPKRMTRARAKAAEEKSKTTIVTTPAARAASKNKRKIDEDGNIEGGLEQLLLPVVDVKIQPPVKSSLKPTTAKKAATLDTASTAPNVVDKSAKPGRGRPRKVVVPAQSDNVVPTKPLARAVTRTVRARVPPTSQATKIEPPKKKVTFENAVEGKENIMLVEDTVKPDDSAQSLKESKPQGFKAKPIRASAASVRRNKTNQDVASQPLSPQKENQTTKPVKPNSPLKVEVTTPAKVFSKPPVKYTIGRSPLRPINRDTQLEERLADNASPSSKGVESEETMILKSPAKRPPQSPFKNAMKESPKRIGMMPPPAVPVLGGETAYKDLPLLQRSPKKFNITQDSTGAVFKIPEKPAFKPSMFTSPARRPPPPLKGLLGGTPFKPDAATSVMSAMTAMGLPKTPLRFQSSTVKAISSSLKVSRTPSTAARVHNMSTEEMRLAHKSPPKESPAKVSKTKLATPTQGPAMSDLTTPARPLSATGMQLLPESSQGIENHTVTPAEAVVGSMDVLKVNDVPEKAKQEEHIATTPTGTPPALEPQFAIIRAPSGPNPFDDDDESDDELVFGDSRYISTPSTAVRSVARPNMTFQTPVTVQQGTRGPRVSMTALAQRFNQWRTTSPGTEVSEEQTPMRQMRSPTGVLVDTAESQSPLFNLGASPERPLFHVSPTKATTIESPQKPSFFEDAFVIMEDPVGDTVIESPQFEEAFFRSSQMSAASQDYGDENMPIDPRLMEFNNTEIIQTCTPARIFDDKPRVVHTVTKVPLKPAADFDETPSRKVVRRGRSLSSPATPNGQVDKRALRDITIDVQAGKAPASSPVAAVPTPRSEQGSRILKDAVVYVDVHTKEGADASGIFVELLTQMGAKCVKQWTWSPRSSVSSDLGGSPCLGSSLKAGITHVVFKDGGKRTMEKVREAGGTVRCVGVNWVLDCERENKWLEETSYAIDKSTVPRGGHRRRKSMEPKTLASSSRRSINTEEFLNLEPPTADVGTSKTTLPSRQVGFAPSPRVPAEEVLSSYATPERSEPVCFESPTTPYFLHPQQLVQQTCPPKQTQQPLFPTAGSRGGPSSEDVRQRLLLARRKSLQFVPKIGSPLAKLIG